MLRNNFIEGHLRNILQSYYFILEYQKQVSKFFFTPNSKLSNRK